MLNKKKKNKSKYKSKPNKYLVKCGKKAARMSLLIAPQVLQQIQCF